MKAKISFLIGGLLSLSSASVGVLTEATEDTVLFVKRTGGAGPTIATNGTIKATVASSSGAQAFRGVITGYSPPAQGSVTVGVAAAGDYGVMSKGVVGVLGVGDEWGVEGTSPSLGVNGSSTAGGYGIYGTASGSGAYAGYFAGNVYVTGTVTTGSDRALKQNVRPLDKGLATVLALQPKAYEMKPGITEVTAQGTQFGLIAQEMQPLVPELVHKSKLGPKRKGDGRLDLASDRPELLSVNYTGLIPVLIKAVQEQQALIQGQQAQIDELKRRLNVK